jgi:hypothetical protein
MSAKRWVAFSIVMLMAAALLAAVLTPSLRSQIQAFFSRDGREILATAEGDLLNDGSISKVIKYRSKEGIYVEVMKMNADGSSQTVERVLLPDKHDGLFNFKGHVTRLAITDIDGDGKSELLAPTFDNQLVPHLNVFRYNPAIGRFEPYQPAQ